MPLQLIKIASKQSSTIDNTDGPIVLSLNPPFKANVSYTAYYSPLNSDEKLPITLSQATPQYTFPSTFISTTPTSFAINNTSDNDMVLCVQTQTLTTKPSATAAATKRKQVTKEDVTASEQSKDMKDEEVVEKKATKKQKTSESIDKSPLQPEQKQQKDEEKEKQRQVDEQNAPVKQLMKLPNGLQYKDEEIGRGASVLKGSSVAVRYQGMLTDGRIFDTNMPKGQLLTFTVGAGHVVAGFEQGVIGMKIGGKRRVIIPSQLGYGRQASGPIPANSTLIFDIVLVKA